MKKQKNWPNLEVNGDCLKLSEINIKIQICEYENIEKILVGSDYTCDAPNQYQRPIFERKG